VAKQSGSAVTVRHLIEYQASGDSHFSQIEGGDFTTSTQPLAAIQPPLRGGPWVAIYDASWPRGHRRVSYVVDASAHIPGRFAIDWIKVNRNGRYFDGDGTQVRDWYGYGAEVLAVADGIVAATRDDVPESATVSTRPLPLSPGDASGNYVALSLGKDRFAFYEHLKPGSIRVRAGQRIQQGSVVGLLGYTGESTGPHLHFHMADRNSPLGAEGLPYRLRHFEVIGRYQPEEAFGKSLPWTGAEPARSVVADGDFPAPFMVVEFP
jgi:murein DD-endopeptidase MepM/ murein hydrolase activator NlpD